MKIGFFDSGIGGLSVLNQAMHSMPGTEFLYYADVDNVPYGLRCAGEITAFARNAVKFLKEHGAEALVIACNTATSASINVLREENNIPIVGMEPAVKPAVSARGGKRVLVCATPFTLHEKKLHDLLNKYDTEKSVDLLPLPRLVDFAEKGEFDSPELLKYLSEEFGRINTPDYSVFVLGCTHFNYFKDSYSRFFPKGMKFIDGIDGTVCHLKDVLPENVGFCNTPATAKYFFSGRLVEDEDILEKIQRKHKRLEEMRLIKEL